MNFNLLIFLFIITACGVKGDPMTPKDGKMPSLLNDYPDIKVDKPLDETKKPR